ncbi:hypothetical protein BC629DRAFT_588299 [Irpex lacteus]|nr:hypothetical protein BC629DRAFT_588299 [Irpex lacteus]
MNAYNQHAHTSLAGSASPFDSQDLGFLSDEQLANLPPMDPETQKLADAMYEEYRRFFDKTAPALAPLPDSQAIQDSNISLAAMDAFLKRYPSPEANNEVVPPATDAKMNEGPDNMIPPTVMVSSSLHQVDANAHLTTSFTGPKATANGTTASTGGKHPMNTIVSGPFPRKRGRPAGFGLASVLRMGRNLNMSPPQYRFPSNLRNHPLQAKDSLSPYGKPPAPAVMPGSQGSHTQAQVPMLNGISGTSNGITNVQQSGNTLMLPSPAITPHGPVPTTNNSHASLNQMHSTPPTGAKAKAIGGHGQAQVAPAAASYTIKGTYCPWENCYHKLYRYDDAAKHIASEHLVKEETPENPHIPYQQYRCHVPGCKGGIEGKNGRWNATGLVRHVVAEHTKLWWPCKGCGRPQRWTWNNHTRSCQYKVKPARFRIRTQDNSLAAARERLTQACRAAGLPTPPLR